MTDTTRPGWFRRHTRVFTWVLIGFLLLAVGVETFELWQQRNVMRSIRGQSSKLLNAFLQGDTAQVPSGRDVSIRLQNVRFHWSPKVYVDARNMALRAVPVDGNMVDFDDLNSFVMALQQSTVVLTPGVLEGMLNESVFNYPESKLRDLKVQLGQEDKGYAVRMTGRVDIVAWIPFSMVAYLDVDRSTNTLVMNIDRMKVFGFLPATKLVRWSPFHLERMIPMPPNKSLMISGNKIMIKPFALFPPPRVTGTVSAVAVSADGIRLTFAGKEIPAPQLDARNYVYLRGGRAQFGHFCTNDTDILILDQDPRTPFNFTLANYQSLIPRSRIEIHDTRSARVTMPDS
jgi:hypothetical protein